MASSIRAGHLLHAAAIQHDERDTPQIGPQNNRPPPPPPSPSPLLRPSSSSQTSGVLASGGRMQSSSSSGVGGPRSQQARRPASPIARDRDPPSAAATAPSTSTRGMSPATRRSNPALPFSRTRRWTLPDLCPSAGGAEERSSAATTAGSVAPAARFIRRSVPSFPAGSGLAGVGARDGRLASATAIALATRPATCRPATCYAGRRISDPGRSEAASAPNGRLTSARRSFAVTLQANAASPWVPWGYREGNCQDGKSALVTKTMLLVSVASSK
eukprot:1195025-Prorocentrum_minimum.AAC.2